MKDTFNLKGHWFLPSEKEIKASGVLNFDPHNGSTLELIGRLGTKNSNSFEIIQGYTTSGQRITLVECMRFSSVGTLSGDISETKYHIATILTGVQIDKLEDLMFSKISAEIHNLPEWLDQGGIAVNTRDGYKGADILFNSPSPMEFRISESLTGEFVFTYETRREESQRFVSIRQGVQLTLTRNIDTHLDDLLYDLTIFQNFLALGLYRPTFTTKIEVFGEKYCIYHNGQRLYQQPVKVYITRRYKTKDFDPLILPKMLFSFPEVASDFTSIISKWYMKYHELKPSFHFFFKQFYEYLTFSENSFLNLAQAIESFHERTYKLPRMPQIDYKQLKKDILETTDPKYYEWLEDQFQFGNNARLQDRLVDLLTRFSTPALDKIIGDKTQFALDVKWSRNYYTHLSKQGEKKALKGIDLINLTRKLTLVMAVIFLTEIGIDKNRLNIWVRNDDLTLK